MREDLQILVIMGSPRKGNTYQACEDIRECMSREFPVSFEYLWLKDADLAPCRGCLSCFVRGEETCPLHDDLSLIPAKIEAADGVIVATPVYGFSVTGQMKILIDRLSYTFHRPRYFGKKALLLTTAGVMGNRDVQNYLRMVTRIWGFEIAGMAGLITGAPVSDRQAGKNRQEIETAARKFLVALRRTTPHRPDLMDVLIFYGQRAAFSEIESFSPADYQYWKEKGWLDKKTRYFTDVPINPLYLGIGRLAGWLSALKMRRDLARDPATTR
jgi:multimeric flavodoxin WrbA